MEYRVTCDCGKMLAVTGADAGTALPCGCGRAVQVPPLHQLRAVAGQEALSPLLRLEAMLLHEQLPGTRDCACCHRETDGQIHVTVQCERPRFKRAIPWYDILVACLIEPITGLFLASRSGESVQYGQDVVTTVPLPVCETCRPELGKPAALRQALRHIPAYAALLDHYPDAHLTRLG